MELQRKTRMFDEDGFICRAACLCVRNASEREVLLVTSCNTTDRWIIPGGGLEPNEVPWQAALREAKEEAGVRGVIRRELGDFLVTTTTTKHKNHLQDLCPSVPMVKKHRTSVFVVEVCEEMSEWDESHARRRLWFTIDEAKRVLAANKPQHIAYLNLMQQTDNQISPSMSPSNPLAYQHGQSFFQQPT